jgi:hypothetical protein
MLLLATTASAYIDPGTGGAIVGSTGGIITAIAGIAGLIIAKYFINPIKQAFPKIKRSIKK